MMSESHLGQQNSIDPKLFFRKCSFEDNIQWFVEELAVMVEYRGVAFQVKSMYCCIGSANSNSFTRSNGRVKCIVTVHPHKPRYLPKFCYKCDDPSSTSASHIKPFVVLVLDHFSFRYDKAIKEFFPTNGGLCGNGGE
jgi:hypothetical protein